MKKLIVALLVCLPVTGWSADYQYMLEVQIDTEKQEITGTARLKADATRKIVLSVRNLRNLKVDGKAITTDADKSISLTLKTGKATLISYDAFLADTENNFIDKDNVFLAEGWYPKPDVLAEYAFSVTLPADFIATSESEAETVREIRGTRTFGFQFEHPLDTLHLAASNRYILNTDRYNHVVIEAYFFEEHAHLADAYIAHAKRYLQLYESMLTPYAYQRFAIVENILPLWDSMPTYTLVSSQMAHSPIVAESSLGHELLHQWFGNSVYIDFAHGNWAEGITSYLTAHDCAAREKNGRACRKQIMVTYNAYVNQDNAIPLSDFISARAKAQRAIGYGKSAMLFHWLRKRYGDKTFFVAMRKFIQQNIFRRASWHDIQRAFEEETRDRLFADFGHWLARKDIPKFRSEDAELRVEKGKLNLNFTLLQDGEPFPLQIPVTVYTGNGKSQRFVEVRKSREEIKLTLDELPTEIVMDENYDIMRQLAPEEIPPVLASIMGKEELTVVIPTNQHDTYEPFVDALGVKNSTYVAPEKVTFAQMKENSFLIAGYDNTLTDMLFGKQAVPEEGVRLRVYKNPYSPTERVMLVHVKTSAEAQKVQGKMSLYDQYTELAFIRGQNTYREMAKATSGISVLTRAATTALKPDSLTTLDNIMPKIAESRIVYVGEQHDKFAHHINQRQVIQRLHESGYELAVGMEMFQVPSQQFLDEYLAGQIDEATFLEKSEYFLRWQYDYNLYKPIIDYVKQENIPLLALNVEGDVTRKVARDGVYGLTDKEKKHLPLSMDISNEEYRTDLKEVFILHQEKDLVQEFDYFLQAQVLWDESMAETAHQFLKKNPERKLVILAGNGHVRHKYGIPDRLFRRNQEPFAVIVQDEEVENGIADFILLTTELKGKKSPRLGVLVEQREKGLAVIGVSDNTPARTAGLQKGDIITKLAGRSIKSLADLKLSLFCSEMGSTVDIQVKRDDKALDKKIKLFRFSQHSR